MTIFKSLTKPHLDYYDIIWDAAWPSCKTILQSIQEKALSIAYQGENDINKIHGYETCDREQKNLKKPRTEGLRKTVYYRAGLAWSIVPGDLRLCTSKLNSRRKSKTFISRDLRNRLPKNCFVELGN